MAAYPEFCLINYQDGDRTVITVEERIEGSAVVRLTIDVNEGKIRHCVDLSQEACRELAARLRRAR